MRVHASVPDFKQWLLVHGQKSIPPLKNCEDLTMKLEVKFLFPTSSSGTNFYIFQSRESLKVRKTLAYGIRIQKIPQKNPHGDTKLNSGPTYFSICHWNLKSLTSHNYLKVTSSIISLI